MRPVPFLAAALCVAGAAEAGSLSPGGPAFTYRCTDYATASFEVSFSGGTCRVAGVNGRSGFRGGERVCVFDDPERHVLSIGPYRSFTLAQAGRPTVIDGQCLRS